MQVQDATFNKFEQDLETEKAYWKSDWKGAQRRNKIFFQKYLTTVSLRQCEELS